MSRKTFRDVHGYLYTSECLKLQELAKDKVCFEVGSYKGKSTLALAETAKKVYTVDTFKGVEKGDPSASQVEDFTTLDVFRNNIEGWANIEYYVGRSEDVLPKLKIHCDLVFIDGAHDYESVRRDILLSWPKLKKGGLMVFHDYHSPASIGKTGTANPNVQRAVDELLLQTDGGLDLLAWVEKRMEFGVVTMWYNEAFLAPFFLNHYEWVDRIHLLLDTDSNDNTREKCEQYANVEIEDFTFPDMMDDNLKVRKVNEAVGKMKSDWVFAVDADEFIFPAVGHAMPVLMRQKANLLYAQMWQVYRHETDNDLDPSKPAVLQRRHGDPNVTVGINKLYTKPIIVRPEVGMEWSPGCHSYKPNEKVVISTEKFLGTHWAMADVDMAVERRISGRRERQSRYNLERKLTFQHHFITEEEIRRECEEHLCDPQLF